MSTVDDSTHLHTEPDVEDPSVVAQEALEVHRDGPLSLLVGGTAGVLAVAFLLRGVGSGSLLDWALCAVTAAVAVMHLAAVVDARAPLLVIDDLGVRVRRGAAWQGIGWSEVDHVEHRRRTSTLRDGELTVVSTDGRRLGVRLSLSTRLLGADWHEVDEALEELSGGAVAITQVAPSAGGGLHVELDPGSEELVEADPHAGREVPDQPDTTAGPDQPAAPVDAVRESRPARRFEVTYAATHPIESEPELELDPDGEESELPVAAENESESESETIVIDLAAMPRAPEPVIGSQLAAARERVGVSVESLAERTRIRPHVIEAIEVDDFDSCGGDFYARGHLRTLARVLGVDATALLALYDETHAHAPIDARRVFEAELAGAAGGPRGSNAAGGGLNWSVLVAAVMAVVLVWSVARLVMDGPVPLTDQPVLDGSPGGRATLSGATTEVPVSLTAATGGSRVIVRDSRGQVVFDAQLAFMQTAELSVAPPVRISSSDGGLLVTVDGVDEGAIGATGQDAQRTYVP